jgi:hypothetical protein
VSALSNAGDGFNLSIADSMISNMNCGNNGFSGFVGTLSAVTVTGGVSWNNGRHGVFLGSVSTRGYSSLTGVNSYDNDEAGFYLAGGGAGRRVPALVGCIARGNGRDATATTVDRSNFVVNSSCEAFMLSGCVASAFDQTDTATATYGFYINNSTFAGSFDGRADGHTVQDVLITSVTNIDGHYNADSSISHPGVLMRGAVDANSNPIQRAASLTFAAWATVSTITSNVLPITTANSLYSLSCTGPQTINDMSFSGVGVPLVFIRNVSADSVTFTHNTAKLRLANATNLVLAQYEAAAFLHISGDIWQQVSAAA